MNKRQTGWVEEGQEDRGINIDNTPNDVFEAVLDDCWYDLRSGPLRDTMTAEEFIQEALPSGDVVLDDIIERLDVGYELGNPEEATYVSAKLKKAWEEFWNVLEDEYHVWMMEPTGKTENVVIYDWLRENDTDGLEELVADHPDLVPEYRAGLEAEYQARKTSLLIQFDTDTKKP